MILFVKTLDSCLRRNDTIKRLAPNPDLGFCRCEQSEAISLFYDEIATNPSGSRNDGQIKA